MISQSSPIKTNILFAFFFFLILPLVTSVEHFDSAKIQKQLQLHWSFVSQIQHTWFKNIANKYFQDCHQHPDLKALYNCHVPTQNYIQFWQGLIDGVFLIKFKKQPEAQEDHNWIKMMNQAAKQWITVNKTSSRVQIQEAYEDISQFPSNLMNFAQFTEDYERQFQEMKDTLKWQRSQNLYLSKNGKDQEQMKKDQIEIFKIYFDKECFQSEDFTKECKMPLERYSYYLKDLFFYYFDQPQKYSKFDKKQNKVVINPLLEYRITKLWRDMRPVLRQHIGLQDFVSLEEVEKHSVDILESVMESLIKTKSNKQRNTQQDYQTAFEGEL